MNPKTDVETFFYEGIQSGWELMSVSPGSTFGWFRVLKRDEPNLIGNPLYLSQVKFFGKWRRLFYFSLGGGETKLMKEL